MTAATLQQAYVECEEITRREARNFHYGIRLLPPPRRAALSAVYALARRIDDIGDGEDPPAVKRQALEALRRSLAAPADASDPVLLAVADVARRLPLPLPAFDELIDGVLIDLAIDTDGLRFADFDQLVTYCRCVAGSVGRLCLAVFLGPGTNPADLARGNELADTLGIGLQQINILRDIREDLARGRVYLPESDLAAHGVQLRLDAAGRVADTPGFDALVRHAGARARAWYDAGVPVVRLLDRRAAACTLAMAGIYARLLDRITRHPATVRHHRLSLPAASKCVVAARALLGRPA